MISIQLIDVHIGHESSVGVLRRHYEYIVSAIAILPSFSPVPRKVAGWFLVLVFAATLSEMALQSVYPLNRKTQAENKMSKLSINKSKSKKVRMNYSRCHCFLINPLNPTGLLFSANQNASSLFLFAGVGLCFP